jgi:hypothetical protein
MNANQEAKKEIIGVYSRSFAVDNRREEIRCSSAVEFQRRIIPKQNKGGCL